MIDYARIEAETEYHRTAKALMELVPSAQLPLPNGVVEIASGRDQLASPGGQLLLTLLVNLLARMKGIVRRIHLDEVAHEAIHEGVPLFGATLTDGLNVLVASLNGPKSEHRSELVVGSSAEAVDVRVSIGDGAADINVGSDAWRAMFGAHVRNARWNDRCPLGPQMAATICASEVFKLLLKRNFGWSEGRLVGDLVFSLLNFGVNDRALAGVDVSDVFLDDIAVAGAGAGGTAAMYSLASFAHVKGRLVVVEPGGLKASHLGRYLMTDYAQVYSNTAKLESLGLFLRAHAPKLELEPHQKHWQDVNRTWRTVVCTVDTPHARWDVQRSHPQAILEAGAMGTLYAVLRCVPNGWCLECKHPYDPEITWKQRAKRWGLSLEEVKRRNRERTPVTRADVERLADVQGRPLIELLSLEGVPFDEVPALTECGETPLSLTVPSQAPILPMATTAAGVVLAAEIVKAITGRGQPLQNYFDHDLRFVPRADRHRFKRRLESCLSCAPVTATQT